MPTMCVTDEIAAALRNSMSPGDRVASWTFRWSLQCGQLICVQCQAAQSTNLTAEVFIHRPGCQARQDERPWQELAGLLDGLSEPQPVRRSLWS